MDCGAKVCTGNDQKEENHDPLGQIVDVVGVESDEGKPSANQAVHCPGSANNIYLQDRLVNIAYQISS